MDAHTLRVRQVIGHVKSFVPVKEWFDRPEDASVWVSAYRAYRIPAESVSLKRSLFKDFGQVRAVFLHWDAPYLKPDQNIIEGKNGLPQFAPQPLYEYRTGPGVLLLLITPLPVGADMKASDEARERVRHVRTILVALMGRNAAYRHEFDVGIEFATRSVDSSSSAFATPEDRTPEVNENGVELVATALEKLSSLDSSMQNRVRLSLRWYQRSFGDDRVVRDTKEEDIDKFVNIWLAWETLVMERYNDINSITRTLADIHGREVQQIGELFPVGRIYGLRGDVLHHGQMKDLKEGLITFMADVYADLLLHTLGLPSGTNTRRYLDGSANGLI